MTGELRAYNPSAAIGAARDFFWGELCDWYLEIIKPRLKDEASAPAARSVLALALDQVLRLFHPFVPFISEVLWEKLGAQCPARGLEEPLASSRLLINAAWPGPRPEWLDEAVEAEMGFLQDVVRGIRDLRSRHGLAPGRKLEALVKADGRNAEILRRMESHVVHLAGLASLRVSADLEKPATAAAQVLAGAEIYLAGLVDPGKEKASLASQRAKLLEDVRKTAAKLANPGFVERAPAEVVEKERRRLEELTARIEVVESNLKALGG